jgi:hypothetical protein
MNNSEISQRWDELSKEIHLNPRVFDNYYEVLKLVWAGLDADSIRPLLRHSERKVVLGGLFAVEELGKRASVLFSDVVPYLNSADDSIRFSAYQATIVSMPDGFDEINRRFIIGLNDGFPPIRNCVMSLLVNLPREFVVTAANSPKPQDEPPSISEGIQFLIEEYQVWRVEQWLSDSDPIKRRFGLVAAAKVFDRAPLLLKGATCNPDFEIARIGEIILRVRLIDEKRKQRRQEASSK